MTFCIVFETKWSNFPKMSIPVGFSLLEEKLIVKNICEIRITIIILICRKLGSFGGVQQNIGLMTFYGPNSFAFNNKILA